MKIQVRRGDSGTWYWRIVARNGQVVLTSETYATRSNAVRASKKFTNTIADFEQEGGDAQ